MYHELPKIDSSLLPQKVSTLHIGLVGHQDILDETILSDCLKTAFDHLVALTEAKKVVLHVADEPGAEKLGKETFESWAKGRKLFGGIKIIKKCPPTKPLLHDCDLVVALWDGIWTGNSDAAQEGVFPNQPLPATIGGGPKNRGVETSGVVEALRSASSACDPMRRCKAVISLSCATESNPYPDQEKFSWKTIPLGLIAASRLPQQRWRWHSKEWRLATLIVVGLLTLISGTIGYLGEPEPGDYHLADAIHSSAAHLAVEGFDPPRGLDESLLGSANLIRVSRLLGLVFFALAVGAVLDKFFHFAERWNLWRVANTKCHALICGLGWHGNALINYRSKTDRPAIAIDPKPSAAAEALCRRFNIPLIRGDASSLITLSKAGLAKTQCAFVSAGSDEENLRITNALSNLRRNSKSGDEMICRVGLNSRESFDVLQTVIRPVDNPDIYLRLFRTEAVTVREFLRETHTDRFMATPDSPGAHVILIGEGTMADEMLRQVLQQCIYEKGKLLRVDLLVAEAESARDRFCALYSAYSPKSGSMGFLAAPGDAWLLDTEYPDGILPILRFHNIAQPDRGLIGWLEQQFQANAKLENPWVTSVIVLHDEPSRASADTVRIAPVLDFFREDHKKQDIALWFYFNSPDDAIRDDFELGLEKNYRRLPIRAFSDFLGHCSYAIATGDGLDAAAQRLNGCYSGINLNDGKALRDAWRLLTEEDRTSSRIAAAHGFLKLRIYRRLSAKGKTEDEITATIARTEHRRWCAEYLLNGYQPLTRIPSSVTGFTPTVEEKALIERWFKSSEKKEYKKQRKSMKRHIDLVPFDDLPTLLGEELGQKEQKKDFTTAESLVDILYGPEKKSGHFR